jgi:type VI secretion system secreted protein VgrG
MRPDANRSWFTFSVKAAPFGGFGVYAFSGREEICKPYKFSIELVSPSANVDVVKLLGTPACLSIADRSGDARLAHGLISEMEQLHTANLFTHYRAVLVPRLAFLDQIRDHRIFQNMTVPDIIQQILKEQGFPDETVEFLAGQKFPEREYCVQYGESYLYFIQRLCEEENIFFYHTHKEDGHCLCFYDYKGGPKIPGAPDIRFHPGSGQPADTAVVNRLRLRHKVNSNAAMYREWNFTQPRLDLTVSDQEMDPQKAPAPPGMLLEHYRYPHIYALRDPGTRYARMQLERQLTFSKRIVAESDVSRFLPGHVFSLNRHPRRELNAEWFITKARHHGEQPGVLEHEAPDGRGLRYASQIVAIPNDTRYVPQLEHPKRQIIGDQTAIVTGPEGEEIYPDKYGRVKVQFFWDRKGQWDEKTTCWIRVSQGWAGSQYGAMAIPRIGHEVIVSFLEGNPDRPLITGRVYHELNIPPYELPANKTRTVFKSMSTPGKENEARGFNELRVEDKKGAEEIYVHAEKDVNVHVKNDWKEIILHDKHETVDNFRYTRIKGEEHVTIEKPRKQELKEGDHLMVHQDSHAEYKTKWLARAGDEIHLKAGSKVVFEAGADLTIKAGGQWIRLDPSGIKTSPKFFVGVGSPGSGSDASPESPKESVTTDAGKKPPKVAPVRFASTMKAAQNAAQPLCSICEAGGAV